MDTTSIYTVSTTPLTSNSTVERKSTEGPPTTGPPLPWLGPRKFRFEYRGKYFEIDHLGDVLSSLFRDLYIAHQGGPPCDIDRFKEQSFQFFNRNQGNHIAHDRFFQNFYIIWNEYLDKRLYYEAEKIWKFALDIAYDWEAQNLRQRIHKGTPYYFWAVTCILIKKLDEAFLLMHQALDEDKETHEMETPDTPAYAFVTLDPTQENQFFREKVIEISEFSEGMLNNYRGTRGGRLEFADFQSEFLKQKNVQEAVFYFVNTVFRIKKLLDETYTKMKHNVFSSLLEANALFDLCLVVDELIKSKYADPDESAKATWGSHLRFLSENREHGLPRPLSFTTARRHNLNEAFREDFAVTLQDLIDSNYLFPDGTDLDPIEQDFAITYGIRNFGGHRLEDQPTIYENFRSISQRILNALFFLVENCQ